MFVGDVDKTAFVLYLFYTREPGSGTCLHVNDKDLLCCPLMAQKFFDEREDQSEVKARIVSKYFAVWAKIIGPQAHAGRIGYIDLFAGPGRYKDGSASTPLMVLELAIGDPSLRDRLVTIFNDEDPNHTENLAGEIAKLPGVKTLKFAPEIQTGSVGNGLADSLKATRLIPVFCFIDPFGYKGLSLGLVQVAIKDWGSECVFFFNYNRINAGLSNALVDTHMEALFGVKRATFLRDALKGLAPEKREALILEHLAAALKEMGGRYVLPFRFRNSKGTRSTHHLVFVSKNVKGYEIMKGIMAKESSTQDQGVASLEYSPADASTPLLFSLQRPLDKLADELLTRFAGRRIKMIDIYDEHHVDTPFIKKNYKDALTALEKDARIKVESHRANSFGDQVIVEFPKK